MASCMCTNPAAAAKATAGKLPPASHQRASHFK